MASRKASVLVSCFEDGQPKVYVAKTEGYVDSGRDAILIFFLSSCWLCPFDILWCRKPLLSWVSYHEILLDF